MVSSEPVEVAAEASAVVEELKYELRFQVSSGVKSKLHKAQTLLSNKHPRGLSLESTLEVLLDDYLERHSREARAERAKKRAERKTKEQQKEKTDLSIGCEEGRTATCLPQQPVGKFTIKRRAISSELKREVFKRDGYCCSFESEEGVKCGSNWDLEIDHIHPVAFGGGNEFENLRVLCRGHNMLRVSQMQESR